MESVVLGNNSVFGKVLFVLRFIGANFLKLDSLVSIVRRFCSGGDPAEPCMDTSKSLAIQRFRSEIESVLFLDVLFGRKHRELFRDLHQFSLKCGMPMGSVLMSDRDSCRKCGKKLFVEPKSHPVVVYHNDLGTYLGSRITKVCRRCKVHEHYGYYTHQRVRHMDDNVLENDFLLSSEDTAFQMSLLKQCASFLVVGAVAFSTFAKAYNARFGYHGAAGEVQMNAGGGNRNKRFRRWVVGHWCCGIWGLLVFCNCQENCCLNLGFIVKNLGFDRRG